MIAFAALALAVTVGGTDFTESFARAKHYAQDPKARAFLDKAFLPPVGAELGRLTGVCTDRLKLKANVEITVVISYRDGKPDRVLLDKEAPFARCIADGLAAFAYPDGPPYPDLAEDLELSFDLASGDAGAK
jgi:hypothetical protein